MPSVGDITSWIYPGPHGRIFFVSHCKVESCIACQRSVGDLAARDRWGIWRILPHFAYPVFRYQHPKVKSASLSALGRGRTCNLSQHGEQQRESYRDAFRPKPTRSSSDGFLRCVAPRTRDMYTLTGIFPSGGGLPRYSWGAWPGLPLTSS